MVHSSCFRGGRSLVLLPGLPATNHGKRRPRATFAAGIRSNNSSATARRLRSGSRNQSPPSAKAPPPPVSRTSHVPQAFSRTRAPAAATKRDNSQQARLTQNRVRAHASRVHIAKRPIMPGNSDRAARKQHRRSDEYEVKARKLRIAFSQTGHHQTARRERIDEGQQRATARTVRSMLCLGGGTKRGATSLLTR